MKKKPNRKWDISVGDICMPWLKQDFIKVSGLLSVVKHLANFWTDKLLVWPRMYFSLQSSNCLSAKVVGFMCVYPYKISRFWPFLSSVQTFFRSKYQKIGLKTFSGVCMPVQKYREILFFIKKNTLPKNKNHSKINFSIINLVLYPNYRS